MLNASVKTLHTFSSAEEPQQPGRGRGRGGGGGIPDTTARWRPEGQRFAASAGMHRVHWVPIADRARGGGRGGFEGFRRRPTLLTGEFTIRLTVSGRSYTQPFVVKPDPRQNRSLRAPLPGRGLADGARAIALRGCASYTGDV